MVSKFTLGNLIRGSNNCFSNLWIESKVDVCLCSSLFEETKSTNNREWHTFTLTSNLEVLERSRSLGTPIFVTWDLDRSESVAFLSVFAWCKEETRLLAHDLVAGSYLERLLRKHILFIFYLIMTTIKSISY